MAPAEDRPRANLTPEQMRQGIRRLEQRMAEAQALKEMVFSDADADAAQRRSDAANRLHEHVGATLARTFGQGTIEHERYAQDALRCWTSSAIISGTRMLLVLQEAASFLTEELEIATANQPPRTRADNKSKPGGRRSTPAAPGNKVFVVHGHDEAARHAVARFIGDVGLKPIILQEQSAIASRPDIALVVIFAYEIAF
jgi:hypothetical protein